ncbi:hypothetical protein TCON_1384 [Astathelohania contejeani]|uniref:J domain-containing protein n=1 Tax=Astathelohania contejeani TaxID=164912 RepID=A0ABQ7HZ29_9MICR|nr:hypothetical protein TCON_1384 [Thelohania contejeani]
MFIFYILNIFCSQRDYNNVISAIQSLHQNTSFHTFYELFDLPENASKKQIRKQYARLIKMDDPFSSPTLSHAQKESLLTQGYNILKDQREAYDMLLANKYYDILTGKSKPAVPKSYIFKSFLAVVLFLILDLTFWFGSYLRLQKRYSLMDKKEKKKLRKSINLELDFNSLITVKIIRKIKSIIFK